MAGMWNYLRCHNAPHAYQLGWTTALQLDGTSLLAGRFVTLTLPSQSATSGRDSGLRLVPDWSPNYLSTDTAVWPPVEVIWASVRTAAGGDAELPDTLAPRLHVYRANINTQGDCKTTNWEASLASERFCWLGLSVPAQCLAVPGGACADVRGTTCRPQFTAPMPPPCATPCRRRELVLPSSQHRHQAQWGGQEERQRPGGGHKDALNRCPDYGRPARIKSLLYKLVSH